MKYPIKAANGHAGEYFFAYKIAHLLKWPCRLIDIDIGIDAQVEVINDDRSSTGRFVAFQIKATSSAEPNCRYVTNAQLSYWKDLGLPVFVVLVELGKKEMYLHRVSFSHAYPKMESGAVRIDFDRVKDIFKKESGNLIRAAAFETVANIEEYLNKVIKGIENIQSVIDDMEIFPDSNSLIEAMEKRYSLFQLLAQAGALAKAMNFGEAEVYNVGVDLEQVLDDLAEFMNRDFIADHDDNTGKIRIFVDSRR